MTATDMLILIIAIAAALYGAFRGFRAALYLLITVLAAVLAVLTLTTPLERIVLDLSGVGADNYPGGPAVAVLLLEGRSGLAYLAAFIPSLLAAFFLLVLAIGGVLLGRYIRDPRRGTASRTGGAVVGLAAGAVLALLFGAQLLRMPWPPAGGWLRGSLILSTVDYLAETVLPTLAGGL